MAAKYLNTWAICTNMVMISILNVYLFTLRAKSEFSNRSTMVEVLWIFNFSITEFSIRIGSFKPHKLISFYQDEPNVIRIFTDNSYLYQIKIWWFTIFDAVSALESYYIISNLILFELIKLKREKMLQISMALKQPIIILNTFRAEQLLTKSMSVEIQSHYKCIWRHLKCIIHSSWNKTTTATVAARQWSKKCQLKIQ